MKKRTKAVIMGIIMAYLSVMQVYPANAQTMIMAMETDQIDNLGDLGTDPQTDPQTPKVGKLEERYSNLVIFVEFGDSDGSFMRDADDVAEIVRNYTDETFPKSLVSYVKTISYGQMTIDTYLPQYSEDEKTITPVKIVGDRNSYEDSSNEYLLERQALVAFKEKYDLSQFNLDENADGYIDNVTFIVEGDEGTRGNSTFYPHKADYTADTEGKTDYLNELPVGTINMLAGAGLTSEYSINSYGVICHEYLHSLGYPDLYTESGEEPVGRWDLMSSASNFLQYPLAYMRSYVSGWLSIDTILPENGEQKLTLSPVSSNASNVSYIIQSPLSSTEFFVIEYRKQGTKYSNELDVKIPGSGLVIYRINKKADRLSNHYGLPYGVYVFRDGETSANAATSAGIEKSFFSLESGRTTFGSTDLSATIKDNALVFADGTNSGIKISEIGSAGDTISCTVTFADYENADTWTQIGDESSMNSDYSSVASVDTDSAGVPYALYSKDNSLGVRKYNGAEWVSVGGMLPDYCDNGKLVIYKNTPYVLYSDGADYALRLYGYDLSSNAWKCLRAWNSTNSGTYIQYASMVAGSDGLYVAYADGLAGGAGYRLKLMKMPTNGDVTAISENVSDGSIAGLDMAADGSNIFIVYRDASSDKAAPKIFKYSSNVDGSVGTVVSVADVGQPCNSECKIAASNGKMFLLIDNNSWSSANVDSGVCVYEYTEADGSWKQLKRRHEGVELVDDFGSLIAKQSTTSDIDVIGGLPVVQLVIQKGADPLDAERRGTVVMRYNGDDWVEEGSNQVDSSETNCASLAVYNNRLYVCYLSEMGYSSYTMVKMRDVKIEVDGEVGDIGDVDLNGVIDVIDIEIIQKHILGLNVIKDDAYKRADANNDNSISVLDMEYIQKIILGII